MLTRGNDVDGHLQQAVVKKGFLEVPQNKSMYEKLKDSKRAFDKATYQKSVLEAK